MKASKITSISVAAASTAAIALSAAPLATSASVQQQPFGARETVGDPGGMMVTAYTVTNLGPSSDVIPYRVMGRLYEATVKVEADRGTITPVLPPFMARSFDGRNYPELAGVPTDNGVNPASLMQGDSTTGKLYFDVVGTPPDSVAYNDGMMDLMLWVGPAGAPPAPAAPPAMPMPAAPMMPAVPAPPPPPAAPMMPGYRSVAGTSSSVCSSSRTDGRVP